MRHAKPALAALVPFVLAACAQAPVAVDPATPTSAAPTPAAATPAQIPSPAPDQPASPPPASGECVPPEAPDLPASWEQLNGSANDFSVAYPDGWEDRSGLVNFNVDTLLDETTLAESGLGGTQLRANFVRAPEGFPNLSVFRFDGVGADSETFFQRQVERYRSLAEVSDVHTSLPDVCLDGITASGLELLFDPGDGSVLYQQSLFFVRDGAAYHVQWLDEDDRNVPQVLRYVLNSWRWAEGAGVALTPDANAAGHILTAGMALEPPPSGGSVDPTTFRSSLPADAPRIYLVYELQPGTEATVTFDWYQHGEFIFSDTFEWTATSTWGWAAIGPPPDGLGFVPGDYHVEMKLPTGESRTVSFRVEEP